MTLDPITLDNAMAGDYLYLPCIDLGGAGSSPVHLLDYNVDFNQDFNAATE